MEAEKTERIDNLIESEKITDLPHSVATLIKNFSPLRSQRVKSSENNYVLRSLDKLKSCDLKSLRFREKLEHLKSAMTLYEHM